MEDRTKKRPLRVAAAVNRETYEALKELARAQRKTFSAATGLFLEDMVPYINFLANEARNIQAHIDGRLEKAINEIPEKSQMNNRFLIDHVGSRPYVHEQ